MAKSRKRRNKRSATVRHDSPAPEASAIPKAARHLTLPQPQEVLAAAALLLMIVASYWPAFFGGFVWDDKVFQEAAPIQSLMGLADIWFRPETIELEAHYWPMLFSSFWLDHRLWGYNPFGFHLTNILLHSINTLLLWRLLTRITLPGAWLIAAVFALHPTHVEAVAWAMGRKDLLATVFYLLAAGCWLRFREQPKGRHTLQPRITQYLLMLLLYSAGMLSKTVTITLPAALLILVWWQHGRIDRRDITHVIPLFVVGLIIALLDISYYSNRAEIEFTFNLFERLTIAGKASWFYLGKLLWPHPLQVIYSPWDVNSANPLNWLPLLAALALVLTLWLARHRIGRGPLAGVLFFTITLSPMLGFANNSYMEYAFVADRYQYLAGTGLVAVLIATLITACQSISGKRTEHDATSMTDMSDTTDKTDKISTIVQKHGATVLMTPLLIVCSLLTFQQAGIYRDGITFWNHIVANNPQAHRAHYNRGLALIDQEYLDEGVEAFKVALEQDPNNANNKQALSHVASLYFNAEEYAIALDLYRQGAAIDSDNAEAHSDLGSALGQMGYLEEAIESYERALAIDPDLEIAKFNLEMARQRLSEDATP
ncbi:MAG: tetratricopeptide repeat protein [Pseudohongiellaceae bacterium]